MIKNVMHLVIVVLLVAMSSTAFAEKVGWSVGVSVGNVQRTPVRVVTVPATTVILIEGHPIGETFYSPTYGYGYYDQNRQWHLVEQQIRHEQRMEEQYLREQMRMQEQRQREMWRMQQHRERERMQREREHERMREQQIREQQREHERVQREREREQSRQQNHSSGGHHGHRR